MQHQRTASPPPAPSAVRGLGVVDALCLELEPLQLAWLADELDVARHCARDHLERLGVDRGDDETAEWTYQLQVLSMIVEQLPPDPAGRVTVVGPAAAIRRLIGGAARNTADALAEALRDEPPRPAPDAAARLRRLAAAAAAFAVRLADLEEIEAYSFDPHCDPAGPER
jgi:hypothetical protein